LAVPPVARPSALVDDLDEESEEEEEQPAAAGSQSHPQEIRTSAEEDDAAFMRIMSTVMADSLTEYERGLAAPQQEAPPPPVQPIPASDPVTLCVFCIDSSASTRACPSCSTLLACSECAKSPQVRSIRKCPLCRSDLIPVRAAL
jgi:hypothetical protein